MKILVTGSTGHLGSAVVRACRGVHDVHAFSHGDLDVTDDRAVAAAIARLAPDAIVNAASYNDVDAAEDHPVEALEVNAFAVRALGRAAAAAGAVLVHYSTDFVFDGETDRPYTEADRPRPRGTYAATKLLGDWFALETPGSYVLRVESLFGPEPPGRPMRGSVAGILTRMRAGEEVPVFEDRTVSPTYVVDAAAATRRVLEARPTAGLYHCVNTGSCTWLAFAHEMARLLGLDAGLVPIRLDHVTLRAARPRYCALSNAKLASAGIPMPAWQDALARFLRDAA